MVEAAKLGQLSTVRRLLNSGSATVEDRDEVVSVCVCIYLLRYFKAAIPHAQQYMALIVYELLPTCIYYYLSHSLLCLLVSVPTVYMRSYDNSEQ